MSLKKIIPIVNTLITYILNMLWIQKLKVCISNKNKAYFFLDTCSLLLLLEWLSHWGVLVPNRKHNFKSYFLTFPNLLMASSIELKKIYIFFSLTILNNKTDAWFQLKFFKNIYHNNPCFIYEQNILFLPLIIQK